jgi:hypothetical protein
MQNESKLLNRDPVKLVFCFIAMFDDWRASSINGPGPSSSTKSLLEIARASRRGGDFPVDSSVRTQESTEKPFVIQHFGEF